MNLPYISLLKYLEATRKQAKKQEPNSSKPLDVGGGHKCTTLALLSPIKEVVGSGYTSTILPLCLPWRWQRRVVPPQQS